MESMDLQDDSGIGDDFSTSSASSSLHPAKYDHEHIAKLETFTEDLQKAICDSFPRPKTPYAAVHVLLLRWAADELNVLRELIALKQVFQYQFRFTTEQWDIPSLNPTRALQTKLYDFQNAHQNAEELLIVYYGGHGSADRRGRSIWAAHNRECSPTLTWSSLQHLLENAVPHVLIILDCCYAANAARDTAEGTTKELLAACGRENRTPGVGMFSFTSALVEELQAFGTAPFTTAMLHNRLVNIRWRLISTPIYALLSEHGGHSIQLAPLPLPLSPEISQTQSVPGSFEGFAASDFLSPSLDNSSLPPSQQCSSSTAAGTRVLLAVSISEDALCDVLEWKQWLLSQAPWDVTKVEVKVEAVYQSHSTILVVSVPIPAWDRLPDRAAYRFIGFVKSPNQLDSDLNPRIPNEMIEVKAGSPLSITFGKTSVGNHQSRENFWHQESVPISTIHFSDDLLFPMPHPQNPPVTFYEPRNELNPMTSSTTGVAKNQIKNLGYTSSRVPQKRKMGLLSPDNSPNAWMAPSTSGAHSGYSKPWTSQMDKISVTAAHKDWGGV